MRLIYSIAVLILLSSAAAAQLEPDKERFDVVLHPGEVEEKTLKVSNAGDAPIFKISNTPVSGSAKDYVFLGIPEGKPLEPQDNAEIKIFFAVPPETEPGSYEGFIYLLDSTPPSMPVRIEFNIKVVEKEGYGLAMSINDAKSASTSAKAEEPAEFDLSVKNLGRFRDIASIDASSLPDGWIVLIQDGQKEVLLPYDLSLDPGVAHIMKMKIQTSEPGRKGVMHLEATSLGNRSKNASVDAEVKFGIAVRGYDVDIQVPEKMTANKTYKGSFSIMLQVREKVYVGVVTPPELMVIPMAQVVEVRPKQAGIANFTMLASQPGDYPIIFRLVDSNGIPMPEEVAAVKVVKPDGMIILTGEDLLYSTVASLSSPNNKTVPLITIPPGRLSDKDMERLETYAKIVILGNESIVSHEAEKALEGIEIDRIQGENLYESSWRFVEEMWQNGTSKVVLSTPKPTDVFRAYQIAKIGDLPLVVSDGKLNAATKSIMENMTKRDIALSKIVSIGEVDPETAKVLQGLNISIEEVAT